MHDFTFERFMENVDKALYTMYGLHTADLADYPYRQAFDEGRKADSVAEDVFSEFWILESESNWAC